MDSKKHMFERSYLCQTMILGIRSSNFWDVFLFNLNNRDVKILNIQV